MAGRALRISQATFDEAVADNIETFGMDRPTAIADAIAQFESSGVDLSNIDTSAGDRSEHPIMSNLPIIKSWADGGDVAEPAVLAALTKLTAELSANASSKPMATLNGGVTFLSRAILKARAEGEGSVGVLRAAIEGLRTLIAGNDDARKEVPLDVGHVALALLKGGVGISVDMQRLGFVLCGQLCIKREDMKHAAYTYGLPPAVTAVLAAATATAGAGAAAGPGAAAAAAAARSHALLVRDAATALTRMLADDDLSVTASKAYDYARTVASEGITPLLLAALQMYSAPEPEAAAVEAEVAAEAAADAAAATAAASGGAGGAGAGAGTGKEGDKESAASLYFLVSAELYSALKALSVNDDICRQVDSLGGIDIITRCLAEHTAQPLATTAAAASSSGSGSAAASGGAGASAGAGGGPSASALAFAAAALSSVSEAAEEGEAEAEGEGEGGAAAAAAAAAADDAADAGSAIGSTVEMDLGSTAGSAITGGAGASVAMAEVRAEKAAAAAAAAGGVESFEQRRVRLVRAGLAVLRALGNSDPNKIKMGEGPTLGVLLQALETFVDAPSVVDQTLATIANLCLRLPDNADRVVARGGLPLVARAMRRHMASAGVQRSACLCLRNVIVKSKERIAAAFDEGFEGLLQQAYVRHVICRDVVYACLRDLGVEYAETMTGKAQAERAARAIATGNIAVK